MKTYYLLFALAITLAGGSFSFADPPKIHLDLGDLNIGPIGYRIESTDFEAQPNRRIVVTLSAKGEVLEIRGRFLDGKQIEEWTIHYYVGSPALAQLKKWRKIQIEGEELGEGLVNVVTFMAKNGKFNIEDQEAARRIDDMRAFAATKQGEQGGAEKPATAPD